MKKENIWISEYQKNKFLENQKNKEKKKRQLELFGIDLALELKQREKAIAIMLDVQGTIDSIDDEKAQLFMKQLHRLRIKYGAKKVFINLSSHIHNPKSFIPYLEILYRNLIPNIILDEATYLNGTYSYEEGKTQEIKWGFNFNKTKVFEKKYLDESPYRIVCIGIIDDSIDPNYIKRFRKRKNVFVIRPTQKEKEYLKYDNLMCHSTLSEGFDGVLEGMDSYLSRIKEIPYYNMIEEQKKELLHLSAFEVETLCRNKNFALLYRYIKESKLDEEDYEKVARELWYLIKDNKIENNELTILKRVIEELEPYLGTENELFAFLLKTI